MNREKPKYKYNFFLTQEEKDLFFTLKKIHRLNNELGGVNEPYSNFVNEMKKYYQDILLLFMCM